MRDVLALIGFQGMVNEIVQGILDPLPLDSTSKVETFHPLCSCAVQSTRYNALRSSVIPRPAVAHPSTFREVGGRACPLRPPTDPQEGLDAATDCVKLTLV